MAKSPSDKLSEALALLEKAYGKTPRVKSDVPMDQLVALALTSGVSGPQAVKTMKALRESFVDWNEIRISYRREIAEVIAEVDKPKASDRAQALKVFLEKLYMDHNMAALSFLEGLEADQAFDYLKQMPFLGEGVAAAMVSLAMEPGKFLAVPDVLRVPGRIGLAGKGATPSRVRKTLEDSSTEEQRFRAHYLFALHGMDICRSRMPYCAECGLSSICEYGKATLKQGGKAGQRPIPPPPKKKAKKAARKKAAPKKAAPKKAAPKKAAPKKAAPKRAAPKKAAPKKVSAKKKAASKKKTPGKKAAAKKKKA